MEKAGYVPNHMAHFSIAQPSFLHAVAAARKILLTTRNTLMYQSASCKIGNPFFTNPRMEMSSIY